MNTAREMVFIASYFTMYEHSKKSITAIAASMGLHSSMAIPLAGGLSGAASWLCRSHLIASNRTSKAQTFRGGLSDLMR